MPECVKRIAVIKGDGIGPEIIDCAISTLNRAGERFGCDFVFENVLMGGCAIDAEGVPLPERTIEICKGSDGVLLGAVGGPKWDGLPGNLRPEAGLLGIRSALGLYANLRPARLLNALSSACPLKSEIIGDGLDLVIVRELTGGAYFGSHITSEENGVVTAHDDMVYSDFEIERICRKAFEMALKRRGRVHSVDKANVLDTSRLWRSIVHKVAEDYPSVELSDILVDNCAMQLVHNPSQFDVIVTENLFGDILSDEASMITGSLGMIPSASLGDGSFGLYEPVHGSAPDIVGRDIANPIAAILSAAMMLRYSFDMKEAADCIESAVGAVLDAGFRTCDIMSDGCIRVGCAEMGRLIAERI